MKRKIFIYDDGPFLVECVYNKCLDRYLKNTGRFSNAYLVFNDIIYISYEKRN